MGAYVSMYPAAIDAAGTVSDPVRKIEVELGINPSGTFPTVTGRIANLEARVRKLETAAPAAGSGTMGGGTMGGN